MWATTPGNWRDGINKRVAGVNSNRLKCPSAGSPKAREAMNVAMPKVVSPGAAVTVRADAKAKQAVWLVVAAASVAATDATVQCGQLLCGCDDDNPGDAGRTGRE